MKAGEIQINHEEKAILKEGFDKIRTEIDSISKMIEEQFLDAMKYLQDGLYSTNVGGIKQINHHLSSLRCCLDVFNDCPNIFLIQRITKDVQQENKVIEKYLESINGSNSILLSKKLLKQETLCWIQTQCPSVIVLSLKSDSYDQKMKIDDFDIMKLTRFTNLASLDIRFSLICDDSISFLQSEYFTYLKQLDISGCHFLSGQGIKNLQGDRFVTLKLNYLNVLRQQMITNLLQNSHNLNYLDLIDCRGLVYDELPLRIADIYGKDNSNLKWLKATTNMGVDLYVHNLLYLTANDQNQSLTDEDLKVLIGSCTDISGLYLNFCQQLSENSLNTIMQRCQQLKRLKLRLFHLLNDSLIRQLVQRLNKIAYLDLSKCYLVTDFSLKHIAINLTDITTIILQDCRSVSDEGVSHLCSLRPNIKNLNLYNCKKISNKTIQVIARVLTNLQSLNLSYCDQITDESVHLLSLNTKIHTLILNYCNLTDSSISLFAVRLKALQRLQIQWCQVTQQCIKYIANLSELHYLNLSYCPDVCHEDLLRIGSSLLKLKCLRIQSCEKVSGQSVRHIAKNIHSLQEIWLKECKQVDDTVVKELALYLRSLKCLDLSWCPITNKSLVALSHLQNLKYLSLNGCRQIQDDGLLAITNNLCRIEYLNLTLCTKLTDNSVVSISKKLHKLKALFLCEIHSLTDISISPLSNLKSLSQLHLSGCQRITNSSIAPLITQLAHLKCLNINQCHSITVECLLMMAKRMSSLRILEVSQLHINDQFLKIASQNLHKLCFINLSSCHQISDKALIEMFQSLPNLIRLEIQGTNTSDQTRKIIFHSITLRKLHKLVTV